MHRLTITLLFLLTTLTLVRGDDAPTITPASAPTTAPPLVIITREAWGSRPEPIPEARKQTPKFFTLHHAGELWKPGTDPALSLRKLQSFGQREKGWPDLPYHYVIAPDGRVFEGRDWHYQPESNTKYDLNGVLNIELLGNFEEQRVSPQQLTSTVALIAKLSKDLNVDPATIRGHKDAAEGQTVCPGKDFYRYVHDGLIKQWVTETLDGKSPDIHELDALADGPTTRISTEMPATEPAN